MAYTFTNYPINHAKKVRPREKVYCLAALDVAMLNITVKVDGVQIFDGSTFIPSYEGTFLNEAAGKRLTLRFRPSDYWQSNTKFDIEVWWDDAVGPHTETFDFTTGVYCFEDDYPTVSTMDQAIMTGFADSRCERLRQVLMRICTDSSERFPQARTIVWLACVTELRTILAGVVDYDLVQDLHLCDRKSTIAIYADLRRYFALAKSAVDELKLKDEAKKMLLDYIESSSPIYAVNAVAAIVVLATRGLTNS
jgi:hypothetical protein